MIGYEQILKLAVINLVNALILSKKDTQYTREYIVIFSYFVKTNVFMKICAVSFSYKIRDGSLLKSLKDDFDATGKCNMEFGKENYLELQLAWATQKNSPLLDPLNKRFYFFKQL